MNSASWRDSQNQETQVDDGGDPLRIAEVFRALTDGVWSEIASRTEPLASGDPNPRSFSLSTIRRNLQREHLRRLCTIVLGQRRGGYEDQYLYASFASSQYPADARSLARLHLKEIGDRIEKTLKRNSINIDDTSRAHLEECQHRIAKVLDAGHDAVEP